MAFRDGELLCDCGWCRKLRELEPTRKGKLFGKVVGDVLIMKQGDHLLAVPVKSLLGAGATCVREQSVV